MRLLTIFLKSLQKKIIILLVFTFVALAGRAAPAYAQPSTTRLLKQDTNAAPAIPLTDAELAELNDPFFNRVLKEHPDAISLTEIEGLLEPDASKRQTFVVDEHIADNTPGQRRRAVLSFDNFALKSNVMLSGSFNSNDFSDNPSLLEVWGWDQQKGRFNYYSLDARQTAPQRTWKFRGISDGADTLTPIERAGTCMQCHVNGAPIMKELFSPWNNWSSFSSPATYLNSNSSDSWNVSRHPRLQRLEGAEVLEGQIITSINRFNSKKIDTLTRSSGNTLDVTDGQRLLKPLFVTTEFNIVSSREKSQFHPFTNGTTAIANKIPNSLFLNAELLAGSGQSVQQGLRIAESKQFSDAAIVQPNEYEQLLRNARVKLAEKQPGDADFAWFIPEPSHIDNNMVDRLIERGIVPREFVAAVMAIDLETPMFSADRKDLLDFVPEQFQVTPTNDLTRQTIAALESESPDSDSPEGQFLALLQSDDPVEQLRNRVKDYLQREKGLLGSSDAIRFDELTRLYKLAINQRRAVLSDPVLRFLDETNGDFLFPLP